MEEILSDIKSGRWWFSTVFVAITAGIIANVIFEFVIKKYITGKPTTQEYLREYYRFWFGCVGSLAGAISGLVISITEMTALDMFSVKNFDSFFGISYILTVNMCSILFYEDNFNEKMVVKISRSIKVSVLINTCSFAFLFFDWIFSLNYQVFLLFTGSFLGMFFSFYTEKQSNDALATMFIVIFISIPSACGVALFSSAVLPIFFLIIKLITGLDFEIHNYIKYIMSGGLIGFATGRMVIDFSQQIDTT
uniref:hypothetical protein n=1 Tax=Candidatus Electronema sp. TaxID=2698783 RepID=UPI0040575D56